MNERVNQRLIKYIILTVLFALCVPIVQAQAPSVSKKETVQLTQNELIEKLCVEHKTDCSLVKRILICESGMNQEARNYKAVVGVDVGMWQINTHFHLKEAERRGLDIYTLEGNLEYGFELMNEQGTTPWKWSQFCWDK